MTALERISPLILRIGLSLLFFYYGISKFVLAQKPAIPSKLLFYIPLSESSILTMIAVLEILIGIFLIIGLFTRTISIITCISILTAMVLAGFSLGSLEYFIAVCVAVSLVLSGSGSFAIDNLINGKKSPKSSKEDYLNYEL